MKLMKGTRDKKGQVYFSAMLALVVIPILLITVAYANVKQIEPLNTPIGRDASAVLEGSYETNNALTYIRESASLASEQAIYDLTQVGGGSECGSIRGYSYWSKACFSPYQKEYFNLLFTSYLDDFLRNYPDTNIPLNNYDITLSKDMLIGSAKNPLSIYLEGTKDNYIGYYTSRPSFSIQNKIDMLKTFSDLRFFIIDSETEAGLVYNTVKCRDDPDSQNELSTCIATAVAKLEPLIPFDIIYNQISEHVVTFDLQSQERLIAYDPDDNAIQSRNIIIKFAIDFSKTEETEATNMGEPVIIQPKVIIAQGVDPKCPTQVEDIPGYIDCISQYYCKLSPEANNKIKDAQQQASDLYGYRLEILEAYRTYDQYYTYGGRAPSILTTDEEGCNIPEIQGKSVSVTFKGVDMAETPSTEYNHPERAKLKTAMEAAGWVNVPGDYTKYECCGTELYNKNRYPDIDYTGASGSGTTGALPALGSLPFEYTPVAEPGIDQKVTVRGVSPDDVVVYLHDVWEIAQKENVNYYLILSIMATESNFPGEISQQEERRPSSRCHADVQACDKGHIQSTSTPIHEAQ